MYQTRTVRPEIRMGSVYQTRTVRPALRVQGAMSDYGSSLAIVTALYLAGGYATYRYTRGRLKGWKRGLATVGGAVATGIVAASVAKQILGYEVLNGTPY